MPQVSIVIPAYQVAKYIESSVTSALNQTLQDIEVIVVDDASTDETPDILTQLAATDERLTIITHKQNRGRHLARKSGVEQARGSYLLFLDGDDELVDTCCSKLVSEASKHDADIVHFGINVVAENGVTAEDARAFQSYINSPTNPDRGLDIVKNIYQEDRGYRTDWRTTQRLYKTSTAKSAFELMTDERLDRAEDCYETLVLSYVSTLSIGYEECHALIYHYGRGVTGSSSISVDTFKRSAQEFYDCVQASHDFCSKRPELAGCYIGLKRKAIELLANDWASRVIADNREEAAHHFANVFGRAIADREFYRIVRDKAYDFIASETLPCADDDLYAFASVANAHWTAEGNPEDILRCEEMREIALTHLNQLQNSKREADESQQPIRIFVATHKASRQFDSNILQPIQVGSAIAPNRLNNILHDDTGENISALNPMYCELTAQYWAWKNVDAEYIGLCHYRRFFNFSSTRYKENAWGEVIERQIDAVSREKYGLDDASITQAVAGYDVITTELKDLRKFPGSSSTPAEQWQAAPLLHDEDIVTALAITEDMYPDYIPDVEEFLQGNKSCFCNMFIMRKKIFCDYCEWLFPILNAFVSATDMSLYSKEALRTPGHLSERLFNIFMLHHTRTANKWRIKQLQCVHFENTDPDPSLSPLKTPPTIGKRVIPVVFASDTNYVPVLTTAVYSMLKNASNEFHYDIYVFSNKPDFSKFNIMKDFLEQCGYATVRVVDVSGMLSDHRLTTNNAHISQETYYRFLIQDILPYYDKVLYLDSDLIIKADISTLYSTTLEDNYLAAVKDIDFAGNLNLKDGKRSKYAKEVLGLDQPYDYFQAGVLLLNTKKLRDDIPLGVWLLESTDSKYIYNDQDILNKYCSGKVCFLDPAWNVMINCGGRIENLFSIAPEHLFAEFQKARSNEKIIHYAGFEKPWTTKKCDRKEEFWSYARQTPFYEELLSALLSIPLADKSALSSFEKILDDSDPIRKVVDPILPTGSRRREIVKSFARRIIR